MVQIRHTRGTKKLIKHKLATRLFPKKLLVERSKRFLYQSTDLWPIIKRHAYSQTSDEYQSQKQQKLKFYRAMSRSTKMDNDVICVHCNRMT